ncbi:flagellar basal-body MS-ring/collar protein FliF [Treponema sp.]|uniref:flagellar basal-body MS-ring/collar protein FliF n=1 Tax=Treponema sp. TaxID=166 RepID=UPI003F00E82D
MNEWFKKKTETIKEKWTKWTILQKAIVIGIVVVAVVSVVLMASVSSRPSTVRLFNAPVNDEKSREQILSRLDQDNIKAYVSADNYISVENSDIAARYRSRLIAEGYAPSKFDAYSLFDVQKWSRTDFDDKVNWKRSMESEVKHHLEALEGIRRAEVVLSIPDEALFSDNQAPTTASVILYEMGNSGILSSKKTVRGIQNLIKTSVEGLRDEDIVIMDGNTKEQVNDFSGMEDADRNALIKTGMKAIRQKEAEIMADVLNGLQVTFSANRVKVANVKIDMDMSKESGTVKEYSGITIRPDNPNTPYDDSEVVNSLVLSEETVNKSFTGTGYNPEGPAGPDGQNPPVYSDMSNVIGKSTEDGAKRNYALNEKVYDFEKIPGGIYDRITVAVNIDGRWEKVRDEKGNEIFENGHIKRNYIKLSDEELARAKRLVEAAVGYNKARGDVVVVENIPFDRSEEHAAEDAKRAAELRRQSVITFSLIGIAVVLVAFIAFRIISREIERRRRLAEEARIRQQEEERQRALLEASQQGMEVTMSVEERKRAELLENALAMAKEHPEDVAMLIRTWLMEE